MLNRVAFLRVLTGLSVIGASWSLCAGDTQLQRLVVGKDSSSSKPYVSDSSSRGPTGIWRLNRWNKTDQIDAAFRYGKYVIVFGWSGCCAGITTIIDAGTGAEMLEFLNYNPQVTPHGVIVFRKWYPHFTDSDLISDSIDALDLNGSIPYSVPKNRDDNPAESAGVKLYPNTSQTNERHIILPDSVLAGGGSQLFFVDERFPSGVVCFVRLSIANLNDPAEKHNCVNVQTLTGEKTENFHVEKFGADPLGDLILSFTSGNAVNHQKLTVNKDTLQLERSLESPTGEHAFPIPWSVQKNALLEFVATETHTGILSDYQETTVTILVVIAADGSVRDVQVAGLSGKLSAPIKRAILAWKFKPTVLDGKPTEVATEFVSSVGKLDKTP